MSFGFNGMYHFHCETQIRAKLRTNCFTFRFQLQWLLLLPSLELHSDGKLKLMEPKRLARGNQRALPGMSLEARYMYLFGYSFVEAMENFHETVQSGIKYLCRKILNFCKCE